MFITTVNVRHVASRRDTDPADHRCQSSGKQFPILCSILADEIVLIDLTPEQLRAPPGGR